MQIIIAYGPWAFIYLALAFLILFAWLVADTKPIKWAMRKIWGERLATFKTKKISL